MGYKGKRKALTRASAWPLVVLFAGTLLSGCSVSMPMGSLLGDDDTTGSIQKPQLDGLVGEDWRRAKAALIAALGAGNAPVAWTNPDSGTKGSFSPVGAAYATASGTCRAFSAAVDRNDIDDSLQGTACSNRTGDWQVTDVRPAAKG
ncbi:RT0821/Lpp0805 family surface protein [uncultured Methylovirgula sp.]|uniref:RT0821/Lpp0805 family surface protein n=1 Tax=uncultured Methylovirgula sp. TaxID=1285960 RepID=UPI00262DF969|nr:RT0821/Lpp0805 family surface protein [uncultured Methylovirgula sp.]